VANIHITEKFIQNKRYSIIKNSEEKEKFTSELIEVIKKMNTSYLVDKELLELTIQKFARSLDFIWQKHLKQINIMKYSKAWWNKECQTNLAKYRTSKQIDD